MSFHHHCLFAAAIFLVGCAHTPVAPPEEFSQSLASLQRQYPSARTSGVIRLFAHEIVTTQDSWGRETHEATGGAIALKQSHPSIQAKAPRIVVKPDFTEVHGLSTVRKDDLLYIGKSDSSKIIIDGVKVLPEGPHDVRKTTPNEIPLEPTDSARPVPDDRPKPAPPSAKPRPKPPASHGSGAPTLPSAPKPTPATKPSQRLPPKERARVLDLMRAPKEP